MADFHLKIIASDKIFFDGEAETVIVPALDGEYAFMAHHDDTVAAVKPGELRYRLPGGEWRYAVVSSGFAQAANNRVTVLVATAERPEEIDAVRAQAALDRAKEALRQKQSIQEYKMSQASLARALSRLREKNRKNINL